ncbi:MAG: gamma-glutamyl-gamma-aminobutyrate hydrolase family protein [Acidimicrobiales bacterium]
MSTPNATATKNTSSFTEPIRDDIEFALLEQAVATGLPTLGICRGNQVLNVYAGGTLDQDEPPHARYDVSPAEQVHELTFAPGSRLEAIYNGTAKVNSLHHQTIAEVGKGLTVAAWAEDGTIEALELDGHDVIAVQWHPEMMDEPSPLFPWLVEKAAAIAAARGAATARA